MQSYGDQFQKINLQNKTWTQGSGITEEDQEEW